MPQRRLILVVAATALLLSLVGIQWGLPARFHPDEKADVVATMLREGRLRPDSYVNPTLSLYLTLPAVALQQLTATGLPDPWSDPLLVARALSAIAAAAGVLLLALAAARWRPTPAPLAALLLGLAPGFVNLGHFATPEPLLLAATGLLLLVAVRHVEGRSAAWLLGLVLGLAVSVKYTAAALAVPALAALWLRRRDGPSGRDRLMWLLAGLAAALLGAVLVGPSGGTLAASLRLPDLRLLHPESARAFVHGLGLLALGAGAAMLAVLALARWPRTAPWAGALVRREVVVAGACALFGFLLGTPGAVFDSRAFLSDLAFDAQTRHEYKELVGEPSSFLPYLGLAGDALTLPVLAAVLAGAVLALRRAWRGDRVAPIVVLAALSPYLLIASSGHRALRFLVPALPAAAWLAALALASVPGRRARLVLTTAVAARTAVAALLVVRLFFVDSRLRAEAWLAANVPTGSTVDLVSNYEGYLPRLPQGLSGHVVRTLSREMAPAERFEEAARAYPAEAAGWLVTTAAFYQRFLEHPEQKPERARFFADLLAGRAGFLVVQRFRQPDWLRPPAEFLDPEIVVLRKTAGGPPVSR